MKRKICVCTGTRAEYGLLKPVMLEINKSKKLELELVVTGMHLLDRFGDSAKEIEKDGFKIAKKIDTLIDYDSGSAMAKSIGKSIIEFSDFFEKSKPDIIVILGDRAEAFAIATAGACNNIPIAHIHAGDFASGGLDEIFRYSISKFSNIFLTATKKSAERIKKTGEDSWRIHVVGAPGIDSIFHGKKIRKKEICEKLGLDQKKKTIVVLQHSVTTEPKKAGKQAHETMEAIEELGKQTVVIYPNSDPGGRAIIREIQKYRKFGFIRIFKNLEHSDFLGLLGIASAMVGNSSSAIIESGSFKLPVVNVGSRQKGRENAGNVINAGYSKDEIKKAVNKALHDKKFIAKVKKSRSPYGHGTAGKKIVKILENVRIDNALLQKKIV